MVRSPSASDIKPATRESHSAATQERLPKWVLVSLFVHLGLIVALLLAPFGPSSRHQPPPSYVVDLVGGERIGGRNLGTRIEPETKAKPRVVEPPPPPPVAKKETKTEKPPKPEKVEKVKAKPPEKVEKVKAKPKEEVVLAKSKVAAKQEVQKKEAAQKPTKEAVDSDENSLDKVRERVIQAAIERARNRAAAPQASSSSATKDEPLSAGSGEGLGAQSLGKGGVGGEGILKSVEFITYQNRLIKTIKANWAWAGRNSNLKVVVQLGINENGQVVGLKVTQPSGDATYDESVIRAIKRSNPFDPPPESVREEFANFNIIFRPSDFGV